MLKERNEVLMAGTDIIWVIFGKLDLVTLDIQTK